MEASITFICCSRRLATNNGSFSRETTLPTSDIHLDETPEAAPAAPVRATSAAGARVFLIEPKEGATVSNPITVKFGAEGIEIAKATDGVKDNSGHHHILLDLAQDPEFDKALPANEHILHYGQGQTETVIELTPGTHTLQLLLAAGNHVPHNPPVKSEKITITVK